MLDLQAAAVPNSRGMAAQLALLAY